MTTRKRWRSLIIYGVTGIGFLAFLSLAYAYFNFNSLIEGGIESLGPEVTGTRVQLRSVRVSPWSGRGLIHGLTIHNPPGFKSPYALHFDSLEIDIDESTVLDKTIVIDRIVVNAPEIYSEADNLQIIQNKMSSGEAQSDAERKLIVRDLKVSNAKLHYSLDGKGGKVITIGLPEIHLRDLGGDSDGWKPTQIGSKVLEELMSSSKNAVSRGINQLQEKATQGVGSIFERARGLLKNKK